MNVLNKTCEVRSSDVQELLKNGILLMDTAEEVSQALLDDANTLEAIYAGIPDEAKLPAFLESVQALKQAVNDVRSQDMSFTGMKEKLVYGLTKLLEDLPKYDTILSEAMTDAIVMTRNCTQMVESLKAMIPLGMSGNYSAMALALAECKKNVEELGGELLDTMKFYEYALKGVEFCSVFSRDPVNLNTGNYIYQKEDMFLKGRFPLFFKRFYNAVNERCGSLGPGWNHNYEVFLEEDEKKNTTTVILSDGREDIYKKTADGIYEPFRFCGSVLEKYENGYRYTTQEQIKYLFDEKGRNIRQEDLSGNGITLIYIDREEVWAGSDDQVGAEGQAETAVNQEKIAVQVYSESQSPADSRRINSVEEDTGNKFLFIYNERGYLETVTDQTGRKICFTYQDGYFSSIIDLLGGITTYAYDRKGKIETVTNPSGVKTVINQFDYRGRTVKQIFHDGGEMSYEYLDKECKVVLTEQNGNRIHYVHDEQKRHIKTIYTDSEGIPLSEESYEYNSKNRRSKYIDQNGNKTRLKYDIAGNVTEIIDPLRQHTGFCYNKQNKVIQVKQADGSGKYMSAGWEQGTADL